MEDNRTKPDYEFYFDNLMATIVTPVYVFNPLNRKDLERIQGIEKYALWDTGSTNSCITKNLASELGLQKVNTTKISIADHSMDADVYNGAILIGNKILFREIQLTEIKVPPNDVDVQIILGMDIFKTGELLIANKNGKSYLRFSCQI